MLEERQLLRFKTYKPEEIEDDLAFLDEATRTDAYFEPYADVGDTSELLRAAANLAMFAEAEEYRRRTGSLELPGSSLD
ncbi:MAG: hypothetical protein U5L95_03555 [Candidatus Saccharibacteria bacterium]|nr:hypothetical protein [Candidatus Saccharibacteria bacterium]